MAKRVVADIPVHTVRSPIPGTAKLAPTPSTLSSRASILASVVPMFRKQVDSIQKTPLLTLKLSSPSFLDTTVTDDVTEQPLYTVTTFGPMTSIKRADPWDGDTMTAEIKWSRTLPQKGKNALDGVHIQMRGRKLRGSDLFFKHSSGMKFNIPNYARTLKWKRQRNTFLCTTVEVKGPIAILDLGDDDLSIPQFQIFETLHDKNDARPMLVHHGVSILLLDYLLVTALFLVTDSQQWAYSQVADSLAEGDVVDLFPHASKPNNYSTSDEQWRKIMYGEPIYPTRHPNSAHSSPSSSSEPLTPTHQPPEEAITFGHGRYQAERSSSPAPSSSESEDVSEHVYFSPPTTRSQSPASESIFSPVSRGAAPSHTYLDPSYYNEDDHVPPVPPIPTHLISNTQMSHGPQSRPSSSDSNSSASPSARRLPEVPVLPPMPPLIPRPRSTPPRPRTSPSVNHPTEAASGPSVPVSGPSAASPRPRPHRRLPQPPQTSALSFHSDDSERPEVGRVRTRSASHSHSVHECEKWQSHATYHQRSLPTPPTSSSQVVDAVQSVPLSIQHVVSEDGRLVVHKEVDSDIEHWVGDAEGPGAAYEMPPPAYNTINFSPRLSDPTLRGPPSPI